MKSRVTAPAINEGYESQQHVAEVPQGAPQHDGETKPPRHPPDESPDHVCSCLESNQVCR